MTKSERIEAHGKWQAVDWWLAVWVYVVSFAVFGHVLFAMRPASRVYTILVFALPVVISNRLTWMCKIKDKRKLVAWTCLAVYIVLYSLWRY